MNKKIIGIIVGLALFGGTAAAQTPTIEELQAQIQTLMQQVQALQEQLKATQSEAQKLKETLRLERSLARGSQGDDIEALQRILATDQAIYPEGLVTGFFGPLTEQAVRRFQEKFGIEQVGVVGPKTREHLNYVLEKGAGDSGVVPPGLLMRFKGQSIFESLPAAAKARCKAVGKIPSGMVPFGIFAECDIAVSDEGKISEPKNESDKTKDESENETENESN